MCSANGNSNALAPLRSLVYFLSLAACLKLNSLVVLNPTHSPPNWNWVFPPLNTHDNFPPQWDNGTARGLTGHHKHTPPDLRVASRMGAGQPGVCEKAIVVFPTKGARTGRERLAPAHAVRGSLAPYDRQFQLTAKTRLLSALLVPPYSYATPRPPVSCDSFLRYLINWAVDSTSRVPTQAPIN